MTPPAAAADHINQQLCDYCSDRSAVLYCRADSAKLCLLCDREVHSTNQLFSKHSRSQLCDRCAASSASIFCETDHSVFCSNCDWKNHSQSTLSVHNRRPIEAFTGCPSVTDLLTALGFDDFDTKSLLSCDENATDDDFVGGGGDDDDEFKEFFDWGGYRDFVSLDNLIVPTDASHNYQALDVPPLPKNRNATCGKQKEEMLHQLGQLAKLERNSSNENADIDTSIGFHPLVTELQHDAGQTLLPDHEPGSAQWLTEAFETTNQITSTLLPNKFEESSLVPDKQLETNGQANDNCKRSDDPITSEAVPMFPRVNSHEINSQERDSAISRYKEKRKTRRYDKHIRYESRKVRAESRTRIKGRFAKIEH